MRRLHAGNHQCLAATAAPPDRLGRTKRFRSASSRASCARSACPSQFLYLCLAAGVSSGAVDRLLQGAPCFSVPRSRWQWLGPCFVIQGVALRTHGDSDQVKRSISDARMRAAASGCRQDHTARRGENRPTGGWRLRRNGWAVCSAADFLALEATVGALRPQSRNRA